MDGSEGLGVRSYPGRPPPLVALHGFTQTGAMFGELAELLGSEVLAPDLPGHGRSSGIAGSFANAVIGVGKILAAFDEPMPLLGYSQGGRVALAVALERPELVSHLVVLSTTPGVEDGPERAERRRVDETWAADLKADGLEAFLERWLSNPMFKGLERRGEAWRAADRAARLENTAEGLAGALVGMGQGTQPYFGGRLQELRVPVLVIAGQLDQKSISLATSMHHSLLRGSFRVVPDAGHAVIGEQPRAVADLVADFLAGSV